MSALAEPGPQPDEPASSDSDEFASGQQAVHLEQLKPGCLDAGEHAVQRGLIRQRSRQDGALSARLSLRGGNAERIVSCR